MNPLGGATLTPEQGLIDLEQTVRVERLAGWAFVRKLVAYVDTWGPGYLYQVADHLNRAPKTLQNYISIARNPISHYAEELGLSRADAGAVLGLPEEEARALLLTAAEQGQADDWLRYEARARKLPPTGKEKTMNERTYHTQVRETLTAIDDGGTQHRANGADPHYGVAVATADTWDESEYSYGDVPFADALPPDPVEGAENDTPFDMAERIVQARGVAYARLVAEEIGRWGEWRNVA